MYNSLECYIRHRLLLLVPNSEIYKLFALDNHYINKYIAMYGNDHYRDLLLDKHYGSSVPFLHVTAWYGNYNHRNYTVCECWKHTQWAAPLILQETKPLLDLITLYIDNRKAQCTRH